MVSQTVPVMVIMTSIIILTLWEREVGNFAIVVKKKKFRETCEGL